jgi:hypothetical protein
MYEYYRAGLDKNQVRELKISKQDLMTFFIDSRTRLQPPLNKETDFCGWVHFPTIFRQMDG